ncbi:MAG: aspartate kinase [Fibrobacterota bacterium]
MKFGGSSVATTDKIKHVADRVRAKVESGKKVVLVLSAMGKTTDGLISLASEITDNPSSREMDMLLSTGEQVTIALFSMAAQEKGMSAISLTGGQVGILASSVYGKGRIKDISAGRLRTEMETHDVVVVAGFQGTDEEENIVTLGRGGSDLSAVALAAALNADVCEIYTDVSGVYTADPRVVPEASKINTISFDEMLEMASAGSRVMQSRSIEVAKKYDINIHVRSTFSDEEGTIIKGEDEEMENVIIRGIAHDLKEAKVTIKNVPDLPGVSAKIFGPLADNNINVDMIIQNVSDNNTTDVTFTLPEADLPAAKEILEKLKSETGATDATYDSDIAKISVVGIGMRSHSGVAAKMFRILSEAGVNIRMISTSEIKISCVVAKNNAEKAIKALHEGFELDK